MSSRKLKAEVMIENFKSDRENPRSPEYTVVTLRFNRKLTNLEVSGVKAVLEGDIK